MPRRTIFAFQPEDRLGLRGGDQLAVGLGDEGDPAAPDRLRAQVAADLHQGDIAGDHADGTPLRIRNRQRNADSETVVGLVL